MTIKPIRRVSVSEQVAEQMKELVFSGKWAPGDQLPSEDSLADMFQVSRVTIRQGIHQLIALGLARTVPGEGTFICTLSPGHSIFNLIPTAYLSEDSLLHVLQFRKAIESFTAELASQQANQNDIDELEAILDEMEQAKENLAEFSDADYRFHYKIAAVSRNPLIIESYNLIRELFRATLRTIVEIQGNTGGLYYHRAILDCIIVKDSEGCRSTMAAHMDSNYNAMVALGLI
jgi:GntR family transcriptional repressor for pyruvate dehydrogenase complex